MTIFGPLVSPAASNDAAGWIAARLGEFGTVGGMVPAGFEATVLVRTPTMDEVDDIAGHQSRLAQVIGRHTAAPDTMWFAIWEGHGWSGTTLVWWPVAPRWFEVPVRSWRRHRLRRADRRRHGHIRRGLETLATFDLPHRRYYLVGGGLEAAAGLRQPGSDRIPVPDLWWPEDGQWFVATDTDLEWTYVGGSRQLVADLVEEFGDLAEEVRRTDRNDQFAR